jgi:hypothetical protein
MALPNCFGDRQQVMPLPQLGRQQVFELIRRRERRGHELRDLLGCQAFHEVVLRHQSADGAGLVPSTAENLEVRAGHLEAAVSLFLYQPGKRDAYARLQDFLYERLVEPDHRQRLLAAVVDAALGDGLDMACEARAARADGGQRPHHGARLSSDELVDRRRLPIRLPVERQLHQQVAYRANAELSEQLRRLRSGVESCHRRIDLRRRVDADGLRRHEVPNEVTDV